MIRLPTVEAREYSVQTAMPAEKPAPGTTMRDATMSGTFREDETDDGWIVLRADAGAATTMPNASSIRSGRPLRPPPRNNHNYPSTIAATAPSRAGRPFDPAPDALVSRYLPPRRALRCDELPPQIHDADVYAFHPAFLASVYPPAAANDDRPEWFFFACRGRRLGGKRRAGPGAYRLAGEATCHFGGGGAGYYRHTFRYHEDDAKASAASDTEWRMDEYGDHDDGAGVGPIDMVVCKVYPARGGALHDSLRLRVKRADADAMKPQVLVQFHLASRYAGDALRSRVHRAADVFASHPAILTNVLPAANDRFEWFFVVRRARSDDGDGSAARARRAGPGEYVPVGNDRCVRDGRGGEMGYRRVFRYREDDEAVRHVSRTAWWMEEYGFGRDFPYGEHGGGEELFVYKVYLRMACHHR